MHRISVAISKRAHKFLDREDGAMTVFGLFIFLAVAVIGGLGLDVANALRMRSHLQIAADSAAHAALVARQTGATEVDARLAAIDAVVQTLPPATQGDVIRPEDIVFGTWDGVTRQFTPIVGGRDAVQVYTYRIAERANPVGTFLLQFARLDSWRIVRVSIADTYVPTCFREGYVAENYVDVTSGNLYTAGFCIHANDFVAFQNNNTFEPGVIVSMPDREDIVLPTGGFETNLGLQEALRDGYYDIDAVARVEAMHAGVQDQYSSVYPDYLTSPVPVNLNWQDTLDDTIWQPGRIHIVDCPNTNQRMRVPTGTVLRDGVLLTTCEISFGEGAGLEDVTIVSRSPSVDSITGAQGVRLGLDDNCAPGGGVEILTMGGLRVPQGLQMYGSRVVAGGPVEFTAAIGGLDGASIISDDHIDGTSGGSVGFCGPDGLPNAFDPVFYRIVR